MLGDAAAYVMRVEGAVLCSRVYYTAFYNFNQ